MAKIHIVCLSQDSFDAVQRIHSALTQRLGNTRAYQISAAPDFSLTSRKAPGWGDFLIVIISPEWTKLTPDHPVPDALAAALADSKASIIPVITSEAALPGAGNASPVLRLLAAQNPVRVRLDSHFDSDINQLIQVIRVHRVRRFSGLPLRRILAGIMLLAGLGTVLIASRNPQVSDRLVMVIERLDPTKPGAYVNDAWTLYKNGFYQQAIEKFNHAIGLNSKYSEAYSGLALSYSKLNDYHQALTNYDMVVNIRPNAADSYSDRAWFQFKADKYDLAIPDFEQSLILNPQDAAIYIGLGWSHRHLGQFEAAKVAFESALRIDPNLAEAYLALAQVNEALNLPKEALDNYREYLKLESKPPTKIIQHIQQLEQQYSSAS
jgi:tetratricopeptide (TPR) repeat protein